MKDKCNSAGFTLVELMVTIAIIGVLAAISIPSFMRYLYKTKTTEAITSTNAILKGAIAWYVTEHTDTDGNPMPKHFPTDTSPTGITVDCNPGTICNRPTKNLVTLCQTDGQTSYPKNAAEWEVAPWSSMNFSITKAHYFRYHWDTNNDTANQSNTWAAVQARADLDCDLTRSTYHRRVTVEPNSMDLEISEMFVENPME